ncbi:hypothetical protein AVEN_151705-1 [Araneus ventricosus]|uniref:Uncharacterized protein n=1 Tax=Araneus ventricosus TaxID=182803 RepID=A0A4Y2DMW7_ARAVE|nr:hypothetical protein AVEN_151705-1 [Araneus ventricosus]
MTRTTPELGHPIPNLSCSLPAGPLPALHPSWVGRASVDIFCTTPAEGRKAHDLTYTWPRNTFDLQWNLISNLESPGSEAGTLPLSSMVLINTLLTYFF